MKNLKFTPKFLFVISNIVLLISVLVLFMGRTKVSLRIYFSLNLFPGFYQHISNFSISYLLLSGSGFLWLLLGVNFKYIVVLGFIILFANFVYELWIPILNTPDIVDAYYGFVGTSLAFVFLFVTKKYGLIANTSAENS